MQYDCISECLPNICKKIDFLICQGCVATCLRCGGYCRMGFVANFIRFPAMQKMKIGENLTKLQRVRFKGGNFFSDTVYMTASYSSSN